MAKKLNNKTKKLVPESLNEKTDKLIKADTDNQETDKIEKVLEDKGQNSFNIKEHQIRQVRLKMTCEMLAGLTKKKYEHDRKYREELDWNHRIQCDGTPNPRVVQELNTYLFVWREMYKAGDNRDTYLAKCLEIFKIMDAVDDVVDLPLDFSKYQLQCFREARDNLGRLLVEIIYDTSYQLLSDYELRMNQIDLETVSYQQLCDAFAIGLYAVCYKPRLMTDNREAPKCDFPDSLVSVEVPAHLSQTYMAVMALWLRWDPYTDRMLAFDVSLSPDLDDRNLHQFMADKWDAREQLKKDIEKEKAKAEKQWWMAKMEEKLKVFADVDRSHYPDDLKTYLAEKEGKSTKINVPYTMSVDEIVGDEAEEESQAEEHEDREEHTNPEPKAEPIKEIETKITSPIYIKRSLSEELEKIKFEQIEKVANSLKYLEKPNELNPRRYWIIGGAFTVEMWKLPMQPVQHKDGTVVVLIIGSSALQPIEYFEKYEPLQLSSIVFSSTSSEDEETDVKKQNQEALRRLVLITIKLPENVLWFENPKPAMWNEEKKVWTTDNIYDIRFNEEKQTVSFRAGRMGSFGLAVNRYSNFPFQSWEIRPEGTTADAGVILSITAATVLVEFSVRGDHAAMVQLQNATTVALQEIVGTYYRPDRLVRMLHRGGVNLFPAPDARYYVDGNRPPKHAVVERHLYHCAAALSNSHQFTASRWNVHVGPDRMVLQMKEIGEGGPYKMVMVTPERAVFLKCNEVSQAFSEEPEPRCPFAPDLYSLVEDTCPDDVSAKIIDADYKTVETLYFLMDKIKFLSYS
ncbi:dynein axonemal intermediate chain 7-like [Adelges cooleyi]|uniref:dynein axonemal intermediate chain 7-like n=1 Tax=Adelges cooleyi TaxID=133065 RepID=UPI00217FC9EE|nr:dynein axonemal intermediate chain 7-like [Adelges cooleyi]